MGMGMGLETTVFNYLLIHVHLLNHDISCSPELSPAMPDYDPRLLERVKL